jgi:hypothetical protein
MHRLHEDKLICYVLHYIVPSQPLLHLHFYSLHAVFVIHPYGHVFPYLCDHHVFFSVCV